MDERGPRIVVGFDGSDGAARRERSGRPFTIWPSGSAQRRSSSAPASCRASAGSCWAASRQGSSTMQPDPCWSSPPDRARTASRRRRPTQIVSPAWPAGTRNRRHCSAGAASATRWTGWWPACGRDRARCWCCAARPASARPRSWSTCWGGRRDAGSRGRRASSRRWSSRSRGCTSCARHCSTG